MRNALALFALGLVWLDAYFIPHILANDVINLLQLIREFVACA